MENQRQSFILIGRRVRLPPVALPPGAMAMQGFTQPKPCRGFAMRVSMPREECESEYREWAAAYSSYVQKMRIAQWRFQVEMAAYKVTTRIPADTVFVSRPVFLFVLNSPVGGDPRALRSWRECMTRSTQWDATEILKIEENAAGGEFVPAFNNYWRVYARWMFVGIVSKMPALPVYNEICSRRRALCGAPLAIICVIELREFLDFCGLFEAAKTEE